MATGDPASTQPMGTVPSELLCMGAGRASEGSEQVHPGGGGAGALLGPGEETAHLRRHLVLPQVDAAARSAKPGVPGTSAAPGEAGAAGSGSGTVLQFLTRLRRHASLDGASPYFKVKKWKLEPSQRASSLDTRGESPPPWAARCWQGAWPKLAGRTQGPLLYRGSQGAAGHCVSQLGAPGCILFTGHNPPSSSQGGFNHHVHWAV